MKAFLLEFLSQAQGSAALAGAGLALAAFVAALTFVPRNLVSLAGGFVLGWAALPVVLLAGTGGAVVTSLLARRFLRPRLLPLVDRRPAWRAVLAAVDREGWRVVALLRLAGPLPCSGQNYLLGLTRIPIPTIALVSIAGALPQAALFVHLGSIGQDVLRQGSPAPVQIALLAAAAACVSLLAFLVGRRARRILATEPSPA